MLVVAALVVVAAVVALAVVALAVVVVVVLIGIKLILSKKIRWALYEFLEIELCKITSELKCTSWFISRYLNTSYNRKLS